MNPSAPSPATPPVPPSHPCPGAPIGVPTPKRRHWLLYAFVALFGLALVVVGTVAITIWYLQRPIKPVVLSPAEKAVVETKLDRLGGGGDASPTPDRPPTPGSPTVSSAPVPAPAPRPSTAEGAAAGESSVTRWEPDRPYVPGSKVLRLTERELNGLLNANTDLGQTVRLELGRDAINAYIVAPIPEDVPAFGGKMFRARGRFRLSLTNASTPYAVLEDVTVFGLSLPKAWLGGLKGENLLGDALGGKDRGPVLKGIKTLRIEPGALVLEVED